MGTITLRCKECSGFLEVDEDRVVTFCPYCGSKELIEESDDVKKERIRTNAQTKIELGKQEAERQINRDNVFAEVEKEKSSNKTVILLMVCMLVVLLFCGVMALLSDPSMVAGIRGNIVVGRSANSYKGEDYQIVATELYDKGFTEIETIPEGDMGKINLFTKENAVDSISINGDSSFKKDSAFPPDATIRIYYHSYPEDSN